LTELVKLRVSQINGCAFCLQLHLNLARKACVAPAKIDLMATWREVDIFSARERTALAWAEALTRMGQQAVPDALYAELRRHFSATETAFLTAAIGTTNAWNRVAGGLRFPPPIPTAEPAAKENTT
jgi:AhpD family alkylhydroperoxidase